jgi:hypothetical protein
MEKLYHLNNLNCHDAHVNAMVKGDELHYGYALGPNDDRYQHCWIVREGELIDLFNWTDHEDYGVRLRKDS